MVRVLVMICATGVLLGRIARADDGGALSSTIRPAIQSYLIKLTSDSCLASAFSDAIPEDLLSSIYDSGPSEDWPTYLAGCITLTKAPTSDHAGPERFFAYVSGFDAGYAVFVQKLHDLCSVAWSSDSMPGIFGVHVDTVELTGMAPAEIVVGGYGGASKNWTGDVFSLDGGDVRLISPRIATKSGEVARGLYGHRWEYTDSNKDGVKEIELLAPLSGMNNQARPSKVLRFNKAKGILETDSTPR